MAGWNKSYPATQPFTLIIGNNNMLIHQSSTLTIYILSQILQVLWQRLFHNLNFSVG